MAPRPARGPTQRLGEDRERRQPRLGLWPGRTLGETMPGYGLHFEVGFAGDGEEDQQGRCHQSGNGGGLDPTVAEAAEGRESPMLEMDWLWGQGRRPGF